MPISSALLNNYFLNPGTRYNLANTLKAAVELKNKKGLQRRVYDNLDPRGSYNYPVQHMLRAIIGNYSDFSDKDNEFNDYYNTLKNGWGSADNGKYQSKAHDELMAKYLGITKNLHKREGKSLRKSKYAPSLRNSNKSTYYALPLNDDEIAGLLNTAYGTNQDNLYAKKSGSDLSPMAYGENRLTNAGTSIAGFNILGDYTIGKGHDKKGDYVSYYDVFDLNPYKGYFANYANNNNTSLSKYDDLSFGLGTPVELYDRIYLDDIMGLPANAVRGSYWLPEITVEHDKYLNKTKKYIGFKSR